jgi:hypothetical protein
MVEVRVRVYCGSMAMLTSINYRSFRGRWGTGGEWRDGGGVVEATGGARGAEVGSREEVSDKVAVNERKTKSLNE